MLPWWNIAHLRFRGLPNFTLFIPMYTGRPGMWVSFGSPTPGVGGTHGGTNVFSSIRCRFNCYFVIRYPFWGCNSSWGVGHRCGCWWPGVFDSHRDDSDFYHFNAGYILVCMVLYGPQNQDRAIYGDLALPHAGHGPSVGGQHVVPPSYHMWQSCQGHRRERGAPKLWCDITATKLFLLR